MFALLKELYGMILNVVDLFVYVLIASLQAKPVFTFANQSGLDMLETSLVALQDISLDKIFDEPGQKALYAEFGKLMEQVYS